MKSEFNYFEAEGLLEHRLAMGGAAKSHGLLTGLLCIDGRLTWRAWFDLLQGPYKMPLRDEDSDLLIRLFESTRQELEAFDFSFEMLLPEDDSPLGQRIEALAEWCQGFMEGLGFDGRSASAWPHECAEILMDFIEIGQLDGESSGEDGEMEYTELSEYVRVAAQIICQELRTDKRSLMH